MLKRVGSNQDTRAKARPPKARAPADQGRRAAAGAITDDARWFLMRGAQEGLENDFRWILVPGGSRRFERSGLAITDT